MSVVKDLLQVESDGTISFGNYELDAKQKLSDFEYQGDIYKVKTYADITKLERNETFVYESVPGTAVNHFKVGDGFVEFTVEGIQDAQITLQMQEDSEYSVMVNGEDAGKMQTNLSGKLVISVELEASKPVSIRVESK
ncbi:MAG: endosialidase [[Clostridium] aminophilum]|uniref:endosialidase n=1 Tax=[Clostridium] aminophilum TaxID=1526 RepID=UPI0026EA3643|nr:endosialidase [[Clostridium] aminophilum]MDD6196785.1 endosialidase [[Clostridium] aminophilum]